jgi:hypothetical protein
MGREPGAVGVLMSDASHWLASDRRHRGLIVLIERSVQTVAPSDRLALVSGQRGCRLAARLSRAVLKERRRGRRFHYE